MFANQAHYVNLESLVKHSAKGASKVKLPGGIVGKTCYVLMSVAASLGVIAMSAKSEGVAYFCAAILAVVVGTILWRLIEFAERRPDVAILEGGEFLVYRQMELAQKGVGVLPPEPAEPPEGTRTLLPVEVEAAKLPDPVPVIEPKRRRRNG